MQVLFTEIDRSQQVAFEPQVLTVEGDELNQQVCEQVIEQVFGVMDDIKTPMKFKIGKGIAYQWGEDTDYQIIKL